MKQVKRERLNDLFREEISYILFSEVKDENVKFVTITDVDVTNDLSFAKVYYTLRNKEYLDITQKALNRASSFIRGKLSERVEVRHTPELKFVFDESLEYGERIEKILQEIKEDEEEEKNSEE